VDTMPKFLPPILLLALSFQTPSLAFAEEEVPEDLREVRPVRSSVEIAPSGGDIGTLIAEAANPRVPEHIAEARFREIVSRGPAAARELTAVFNDTKRADLEVWVAARALGRVGGQEALQTLMGGLKSKRIMARLGSVSGLGLLGDQQAVSSLEATLYDKAMMVRAAAADALGLLGQPASAAALGAALDVPANFRAGQSLFVRKHIIDAIGALGSTSSLPLLVKSTGDADPTVQLAARNALIKMTGESFGRSAQVTPEETQAWQTWLSSRGR
jgi:HEAT repeat protein